jgi:hypothetical protein
MYAIDDAWLESLPAGDGPQPGGLTLVGLLVRSPDDRLRLLMGGLCLDFAAGDVAGVTPIGLPAAFDTPGAVAVEATLRAGAPLLGIHDAKALRTAAAAGRAPFAIATRSEVKVVPPSTGYAREEAAYLRRHRLIEE